MASLPASARFWMVCRQPKGPGSKTEPRQRYLHPEDAREAAAKLAQENDHPFVILTADEVIYPTDKSEDLFK